MNINWFELLLDFFLLGLLAVPGIAFLWLGVRHRKSGPVCQGCRYSMVHASSLTCPECGRTAKNTDEFLKRRIRWDYLALGILLCIPQAIQVGTWIRGFPHAWQAVDVRARLNDAQTHNRISFKWRGFEPYEYVGLMTTARQAIFWSQGKPAASEWELYHYMPSHRLHGWHITIPPAFTYACYIVDFIAQPEAHMVRHFNRGIITEVTLNRPMLQDIQDVSSHNHVQRVSLNFQYANTGQDPVQLGPRMFSALKRFKYVWDLDVYGRFHDPSLAELIDAWTELDSVNLRFLEPQTAAALGRHGEITTLRISDATPVTDQAFQAFCHNRRITNLSLSSLPVSDEAFASLGQMSQLTYLNLSSRRIHPNDIHILGRLTNLRQLTISPRDPAQWHTFGDLQELKNLKTLEVSLLLQGPIVSRPNAFPALESLYLQLKQTHGPLILGDLSQLISLKALHLTLTPGLGATPYDLARPPWPKFYHPRIPYISVSAGNPVDGTLLPVSYSMQSARPFPPRSTLEFTPPRNLTRLLRQPTDYQGWEQLALLKGLTTLSLQNVSFTADEQLAFLHAMPQLRNLTLRHDYSRTDSTLTGDWVAALGGCRNLETLDIAMGPVTPQTLFAIGRLPRLADLRLIGARSDSSGLAAFAATPTLRKLTLFNVTDAELEILGANPHLKTVEIDLEPGQGAPQALARLFQNQNLRDVRIYHTQWSPAQQQQFKQMNVTSHVNNLFIQ